MWSDRVLENWNLYKRELNGKHPSKGKSPAPAAVAPATGVSKQELDRRIREVVENYENSTSWKITKPLRALGRLFKK